MLIEGRKNMNIVEVTKDNWEHYRPQMLNLEDKVKGDMVKQGIGDLFFTTGEDIKDYAHDPRHHVYVMVDKNDKVLAQTYLIGAGSHIQGDYADLPKYFTMGENFLQYVKTKKYGNTKDFLHMANSIYLAKTYAFKYALRQIYGTEDVARFMNDLNKEKASDTHFDERTQLRRDINKYMSQFLGEHGMEELYRQFYNIDSNFVNFNGDPEIAKAYDSFLDASKVTVYSQRMENPEDYFEASVYNTIEVDTYITDPEARRNGSAKILSTIALNKTITEFFEKNDSDILYLSITLHKDNYLSENVANFLGFKDYIDLERRATIERKAYMKRIDRSNYEQYLSYLNKKLTYFYGYGNEEITEEDKDLFEAEKEFHNEDIAAEIDYRLETEQFDDATRKFIESVRDNIAGNTLKSPKQKDLTVRHI